MSEPDRPVEFTENQHSPIKIGPCISDNILNSGVRGCPILESERHGCVVNKASS
jgi:hypothetical protein